jgi:hypothetical protein
MTVLAWHLVTKDQDCACDRPRTGQPGAAQARARGGFHETIRVSVGYGLFSKTNMHTPNSTAWI